ncbi:cytochrome p450 protein [Purpureocillium lavendulum]|uniref:Cytochrome p450 protein n=1 Tax=Purpureocillium lavendulum TaxID=1247861 RepID=A0AB34FKR9_9HYPO|nr:cytochrome p450 protein [Purpureocillium lavendulum]
MRPMIQSSMDPSTVLGSLGLLVLARLAWVVLYRLYLHPLAKYPGPLLGKLTGLYMVALMVAGKATYSRYEWHKKYGRVVRTGPDELCFADETSIKDIYGQSSNPCPKAAPFYSGISLNIATSLFTAVDRVEHARIRRLLAHQFSAAGIKQCLDEISDKVTKFCDRLQASSQPVNIHGLTHDLYLDIISQLSFAKSFDLLSGEHSETVRDMQTYFSIAPLYGIFPMAKVLPFGVFAAARRARPRIVRFVRSCIDDFRHRVSSKEAETGGLLRQMMEAEDSEATDGADKASFSDAELIENAVLFINAGSETTATTLLYLLYEVGIRPEMHARLAEEIRTSFPDRRVFPDLDTAEGLPYLNCVTQEVLRLRGPASAMAPRISPGKIIAGQYVPKGIAISSQPYTTQRDPDVFSDPLKFDPDRWQQPTPAMKHMQRPFLSGPRNCIGVHLARAQLLLTVCALYQRFEIQIDRTRTTDDMMKMRDMGLMSPMGKQLWISIEPL